VLSFSRALDSVILSSLLPFCFPSHFPSPYSSCSSCNRQIYFFLHGVLGSYTRDALQEGGSDAVACLPVPRACKHVVGFSPPLFSLFLLGDGFHFFLIQEIFILYVLDLSDFPPVTPAPRSSPSLNRYPYRRTDVQTPYSRYTTKRGARPLNKLSGDYQHVMKCG
jgi:hypothetical protein